MTKLFQLEIEIDWGSWGICLVSFNKFIVIFLIKLFEFSLNLCLLDLQCFVNWFNIIRTVIIMISISVVSVISDWSWFCFTSNSKWNIITRNILRPCYVCSASFCFDFRLRLGIFKWKWLNLILIHILFFDGTILNSLELCLSFFDQKLFDLMFEWSLYWSVYDVIIKESIWFLYLST